MFERRSVGVVSERVEHLLVGVDVWSEIKRERVSFRSREREKRVSGAGRTVESVVTDLSELTDHGRDQRRRRSVHDRTGDDLGRERGGEGEAKEGRGVRSERSFTE